MNFFQNMKCNKQKKWNISNIDNINDNTTNVSDNLFFYNNKEEEQSWNPPSKTKDILNYYENDEVRLLNQNKNNCKDADDYSEFSRN